MRAVRRAVGGEFLWPLAGTVMCGSGFEPYGGWLWVAGNAGCIQEFKARALCDAALCQPFE